MCQALFQAHGCSVSEAGRAPVLADLSAGCQRQGRVAGTEGPTPSASGGSDLDGETDVEVSLQSASWNVTLVCVLLS